MHICTYIVNQFSKTGVMTFQQNFLRFENRRIWVAGVRLKVVPYPLLRYTAVHRAPWHIVHTVHPGTGCVMSHQVWRVGCFTKTTFSKKRMAEPTTHQPWG